MDVRVSSGMKELELYLLQVESLDISSLQLDQLISCHIEVDFNLSTVVVDLLLVLHQAAEVLDVSLKQHLVTEVVKLYSLGTLPQQMGW